MTYDIWIEQPKLNKDKQHKKRQSSYHRDNKTYGHTTIGGIGIVGKLRRKRKNAQA